MNTNNFRALIVEDDRSWQQILSEIITDSNLEVDIAGDLESAILALKENPHRLAIVDLSLSPNDHNNYDGLKVLEAVRRQDPTCKTILLTGFATVELAVTSLTEFNAFSFLRKENFNRSQFRDILYRALASAPPLKKNNPPEQIFGGENSPIQESDHREKNLSTENAIIVEDDAGWRSIIAELLQDAGFQVHACSGFGEALGYLRRERFSIAVVDLSLSDSVQKAGEPLKQNNLLEGYQLLTTTRSEGIPTIVVSGIASTEYIKKAYAEESIFAFLEKQTFNRASFLRIVEETRKMRNLTSELNVLTEREREVFDHLAVGLTNKEIAEKLVITTNTVKRHIKAIFEKLDVHTRSAATAKAKSEK